MVNDSDFSLNNLNTNPSFNFCKSLLNADLYSLNPHDDNIDDSPYSNLLRSNSTQGGGVGIYIKKISNITFYVIKVFLLIGFSNPYSLKSGPTKIKKL